MRGVQFVVDEDGQKTAVLLDLQEWGELWEDFYDVLVSQSRAKEESVSWADLEAELNTESPNHGAV
ncbi:MAG: hypothetical protein VKL39_05960 [Leptolyngbyaceae bacterium]|nr:hypothetical protein [Leptolyngbyaceae bacterium]